MLTLSYRGSAQTCVGFSFAELLAIVEFFNCFIDVIQVIIVCQVFLKVEIINGYNDI